MGPRTQLAPEVCVHGIVEPLEGEAATTRMNSKIRPVEPEIQQSGNCATAFVRERAPSQID